MRRNLFLHQPSTPPTFIPKNSASSTSAAASWSWGPPASPSLSWPKRICPSSESLCYSIHVHAPCLYSTLLLAFFVQTSDPHIPFKQRPRPHRRGLRLPALLLASRPRPGRRAQGIGRRLRRRLRLGGSARGAGVAGEDGGGWGWGQAARGAWALCSAGDGRGGDDGGGSGACWNVFCVLTSLGEIVGNVLTSVT